MTCYNGSANNLEKGIVLNDITMFSFDDGNISGVLGLHSKTTFKRKILLKVYSTHNLYYSISI